MVVVVVVLLLNCLHASSAYSLPDDASSAVSALGRVAGPSYETVCTAFSG